MMTSRESRLSWSSSTSRGRVDKHTPPSAARTSTRAASFTARHRRRATTSNNNSNHNQNKPTLETYQQMEAHLYGLSSGEKIDPAKAAQLAAQYPYDPVMTAFQADWHLRHAGQIKTADELWQRSVQQGLYAAASSTTRPHPYAKYFSGMLFTLGKAGLKQNYKVAVVWYTKAAADGVASAHFQLGWLHETNVGQSLDKSSSRHKQGAGPDMDQARYHYEQAAAVGHAAAQYNLAELLMKHYATPRAADCDDNDDETTPMAHMLYVQAALQGYTLAKTRLKQLFAPASVSHPSSQDLQEDRRIQEEHEQLRVLLRDQEAEERKQKRTSSVTESAVSHLIADLLGENDRWSSAVREEEASTLTPSNEEHTSKGTTDTSVSATNTRVTQTVSTKGNEAAVEREESSAPIVQAETETSKQDTGTAVEREEASATIVQAETETSAKQDTGTIVTEESPVAAVETARNEAHSEVEILVTEESSETPVGSEGTTANEDEGSTSETRIVSASVTEEEPAAEEAEPTSVEPAATVTETAAEVSIEELTSTPTEPNIEATEESAVDTREVDSETRVEEAAPVVDTLPTNSTESVAAPLSLPVHSQEPLTTSLDSIPLEAPPPVTSKTTTTTVSATPPSSPEAVSNTALTAAAASSLPPTRQPSTSGKLKELLDKSRQLRTAVADRHNEVSISSLNYNDNEVDQLVQESRRFRAEAAKRERRVVEVEKDTHSVLTNATANTDVKQKDPPREDHDPTGGSDTDIEEAEVESEVDETPVPIHEIQFTANIVDEENQPLTSPEEWYDNICALLDGLNKVQINPTLALRQVNRARAKLVDEDEDPILTAFSAECHEHLGQGARTDSLMLQAVQQGLLHQAKQKAVQSSSPTNKKTQKYAQFFVGTLCEHGRGGALPSAEKAAVWYKQAASQGLARAYYAWGNLYFHGQLGDTKKRDYKRARILYHKAATQGHALAQTSLAEMYERGFGVAVDVKKAFDYEERSALQGPAQAQVLRGALYENGQIPGGVDVAKEWYERAAAQEHAGASYHLGMLYQKGLLGANPETGEPDLGKATEYFQTAANQGHAKAKAALESLQTRQWIGGLFDWGQVVNSFTGKA